MAVHIRLRRTGKKKQPNYRIVAADSRRARDGRFLETLGTYNPVEQPASVQVKEDRLTHWFNEGAIPSDTVKSLLTQIGFIEKYHKMKAEQDVSEIVLKTTIDERKKKTRKTKKAVLAASEAKAEEAAKKEKAAEAAKKEETAKAEAVEEAAKPKEAAKAEAVEEAPKPEEAAKAETVEEAPKPEEAVKTEEAAAEAAPEESTPEEGAEKKDDTKEASE